MRHIFFGILVFAFIGLYSCGGEDLVVEADFDYELVDGNTYKFNVLTKDYSSVKWTIEGNTYSDASVNHTFSAEGTFDVVLEVILENDKGDLAVDEVTKSITISLQYECLRISTKNGVIQYYLYQSTPKHKENAIKLAKDGFYNGTTFHRIIKGFMIQGGDPNSKDSDPSNDGIGGPGYTIDRELNNKLTHIHGAVGAARKSTETASNGSQFYIVENSAGAHHLDGGYTVFGMVFDGLDVVSAIASNAKDSKDRPLNDIEMSVQLVYYSAKTLKDTYGFEIPAE